ncbi:MAG: DUF3617 domain-containing protein [Erythrobacter sp.]|uniref:DUF3617 domain-containing protein n=1 Tax=Erythrobacter sp. TaxID=1042 RepID=UPI0025D135A3|nr:DUF3617 family protein [Erythrobacter sp.]MCL9999090.1 DUF3617 domain-containing protein [Erythrobacter sp.]
MRRSFIGLAMIAGAAVPALAEGDGKLELFRAFGLAEGRWATVLTIEKVVLTPDPERADDPDAVAKAKAAQTQVGRIIETTDCLGNALSAKGELILPGVAIGGNCTITDQAVTGDRFAFTVRCGEQSEFGLTFKGTKTGKTIQGTVDMHGAGAGMTMESTTRIEGKWVGTCTAG